jgi:hypothetical protein
MRHTTRRGHNVGFYTPPLFKPGFAPGLGNTHGGGPLDDLGLGRDVFSVSPRRNVEPMMQFDFPDFQYDAHKRGGTLKFKDEYGLPEKVILDDYQNQIGQSIADVLGTPKRKLFVDKKLFGPPEE